MKNVKSLVKRTLVLLLIVCTLFQSFGNLLDLKVNAQAATNNLTSGALSEAAPTLTYMFDSTTNWNSFRSGTATASHIDGIRIQTNGKPYYLKYMTQNLGGGGGFYSEVDSRDTAADAFAGSAGKPIQKLSIHAYSSDGTKLRTGVIVMYRAYVNGNWLPWVSNADPQPMQDAQSQFSLGGTLDTVSGDAGASGSTISGVQIRIFEDSSSMPTTGSYSGKEEPPRMGYLHGGSWTSINNGSAMSAMDGIMIQTDSSKPYYLTYSTKNEGSDHFYTEVSSTGSEYAGLPNHPVQQLSIYVHNRDGSLLKTNVVVMYRAYVEGRWLSWVSNANPEWMESVQAKYNLGGTLDTHSWNAGIDGKNISGIEIRIFEENSVDLTPVGNYKILQTPNIYQFDSSAYFPTGCESVSSVMALHYWGIDTSLGAFVDTYLDKADANNFNPDIAFGGNPRVGGYGCYAPVIEKDLNKILATKDFYAKRFYDVPLQQLCSQYIDNNIPVILWATSDMSASYIGKSLYYNGQYIGNWIAPEHCLLLVGYDDSYYYFNDSMKNVTGTTRYSKSAVETAYRALHSQAVIIRPGKDPDSSNPTDPTSSGSTSSGSTSSGSTSSGSTSSGSTSSGSTSSGSTSSGSTNPSNPTNPTNHTPVQYTKPCTLSTNYNADPIDLSSGSHVIDTSLMKLSGSNGIELTASYNSSRLTAGSMGIGWSYNFEKTLEDKVPGEGNSVGVTYDGHVQDVGWQPWVVDNQIAGTTGQSLRLEAIKIQLVNPVPGMKIKYQSHVQDVGWQDWVYDGNIAGTIGQSKRIEAIRIQLEGAPAGYSIRYQAHVGELGWTNPVTDGAIAGTVGQSKRIEAIRIEIVKPMFSDTIKVYDSPSVYSVYNRTSDNVYTCTSKGRNNYVLTKQADGTYILNCNNEKTEYYDTTGKLAKIEDQHKFVTNISYSGNTVTVSDPLTNKHIYLTKDASSGKITRISDDASREVLLGYTDNCLTSIKDVNGYTLKYTYDDQGRIKTGTDAAGVQFFTNTYDDQGRVINQLDGLAGSAPSRYSYTTNDNGEKVTTVTDRNDHQSTRVYNIDNQLIKYTDENGNSKFYAYDTQLNLISEQDALGHTQTTTYNAFNKPLVQTDKRGNQTKRAYDGNGNVTSVTYADGSSITYAYNSRNMVTEQTDSRGTKTIYAYDANGQLTQKQTGDRPTGYTYQNGLLASKVDPMNGTTSYSYNEKGQMTSSTDALNHTLTYTYDNKGNVLEIKDSQGHSLAKTVYDCNGNKTSSTDANGNTTLYTYNGNMKPTKATMPDGGFITYDYDGEDRLVKTTDQNGKVTTTTYDPAGRILEKTDAAGAKTSYEYDAVGNVTKQTNPNGGAIVIAYDANGNVTSRTDAAGNATTYEYDALNRLTKMTNAMQGVTVNAYNAAGDLLSVTDALGNKTEYQYDAYGNKTSSKDARGNTTAYTYDKNNNLLTTTDALNHTVTNTYNANNKLASRQDQNGYTTTFAYDALERMVSQTDPYGHTVSKQYDGNGNVLTTTDAKGNIQSTSVYNSLNLPISVTDAAGNTTTSVYDSTGKLVSTTDSLNNGQTFEYDADGNLVKATNQISAITTATYDPEGNITSLVGPLDGSTHYTYDSSNRLLTETTASNGTIQYGYNALNLKSDLTNAKGQATHYTYDKLGRITSYTNTEGSASYAYDANGNVLTAADSKGTITREYDVLNRITKYTDTNGQTIKYEYDNAGNLKKLIYPDNTSVIYTYDENNNLLTVTDWSGRVTTYTYDVNNHVTGVVKPDGSVTTTQYDNAQRVVSTVEKTASGVVIVGYEYTYDELGRIITETSLADNKKYEMTYDNLSRVTIRKTTDLTTNQVTQETYQYDAAGNITSCTVDTVNNQLVYDANNRLTSYNGHAVQYDADGNMTSGFINGADMSLQYDSSNRLTSAGANTYTYDIENNRAKNLCGDSQKLYTYDTTAKLSRLLTMTDQNGNVTKYVYGLGLIGQEDSSDFKTYHFDYRGSTTAITNAQGVVTDTFTYDTYGKLLSRTGSTDTPFLYNGRDGVMTDENGLLYMRARYYSPELKRFINADIIKGNINNSETLNRYAYANGNPISNVDPFGLSAERSSSSFNMNTFMSGALLFLGGVVAVAAIISTGGAATPLVAAGYAAVGTAGISCIGLGGSDIYESVTGNNPVKSYVGEPIYNELEFDSAVISIFGSDAILAGAGRQPAIDSDSTIMSTSPTDLLANNRNQGTLFEKQEFEKFNSNYIDAAKQITIKTPMGTKTRVDAIGLDSNGNVVINEFKSSSTAGLTSNQKIAFPEIYSNGGTVVGKGKGIFTGGYQIPAGTETKIIRP